MYNYKEYTIKEFANLINENSEEIQRIFKETPSYATNVKEAIELLILKSSIKEENREEVVNYIYCNLYNSSPRFHTRDRKGVEIYSTPCSIF